MAKTSYDASALNKLYEFFSIAKRRLSLPIATMLLAEMKDRIFDKGLDSDEKVIGTSYSSSPLYVTEKDFVRKTRSGGRRATFRPMGMLGDTVHDYNNNIGRVSKNYRRWHARRMGQAYRTMYVAGGWKEIRIMTGRKVTTVDLNYTGSLNSSLQTVMAKGKDSTDIIIANKDEVSKSYNLERKYGKRIFFPTNKEIEKGNEEIIRQINKILGF
jgi:hypothetical protein